jgi:hypothetical protein
MRALQSSPAARPAARRDDRCCRAPAGRRDRRRRPPPLSPWSGSGLRHTHLVRRVAAPRRGGNRQRWRSLWERWSARRRRRTAPTTGRPGTAPRGPADTRPVAGVARSRASDPSGKRGSREARFASAGSYAPEPRARRTTVPGDGGRARQREAGSAGEVTEGARGATPCTPRPPGCRAPLRPSPLFVPLVKVGPPLVGQRRGPRRCRRNAPLPDEAFLSGSVDPRRPGPTVVRRPAHEYDPGPTVVRRPAHGYDPGPTVVRRPAHGSASSPTVWRPATGAQARAVPGPGPRSRVTSSGARQAGNDGSRSLAPGGLRDAAARSVKKGGGGACRPFGQPSDLLGSVGLLGKARSAARSWVRDRSDGRSGPRSWVRRRPGGRYGHVLQSQWTVCPVIEQT